MSVKLDDLISLNTLFKKINLFKGDVLLFTYDEERESKYDLKSLISRVVVKHKYNANKFISATIVIKNEEDVDLLKSCLKKE